MRNKTATLTAPTIEQRAKDLQSKIYEKAEYWIDDPTPINEYLFGLFADHGDGPRFSPSEYRNLTAILLSIITKSESLKGYESWYQNNAGMLLYKMHEFFTLMDGCEDYMDYLELGWHGSMTEERLTELENHYRS